MISSLELARRCGVSQGTVDRALHDRPGINAQTKARILRMAARHGYRPHPAALELLSGRTRTVGAVIPSRNSLFFMDLLNTIHAQLVPAGYRFLHAPAAGKDEMLNLISDFSARRARGIIVIPPEDNIPIPAAFTRTTPVISLLSPCKGRNTVFLSPDEAHTGRTAVDTLAGLGHRHIAHCTYTRDSHAIRARRRGYEDAMQQRGLTPIILAETGIERLSATVRKKKITALFCHNDWLALSAIRTLERHGLRVPHDISVLGVDNSPSFTALYPDITTLDYPAGWIARQIARVLDGQRPAKQRPSLTLVERRTVGPTP